MNNLLKQAKEKFPKGSLFYSASGLINSPIRVTSLRESENYKGVIVNSEGGVIYDGESKVWAKKI